MKRENTFSVGDRVKHIVSQRVGQVVGNPKSPHVQVRFDGDASYMKVLASLLTKVNQ